jgi:hypothetical protein
MAMGYWDRRIEITPMQLDGRLAGFLLVGRWPRDTVEWTRFLALAVQLAAAPGMLPEGSTVFRVVEDVPAQAPTDTIGLVLAEGPLLGDTAVTPGHYTTPPPALAVLHPPGTTVASVREYTTASGCLFLPGLPHLGLDHRAAWIEADVEGTITRLASRDRVDPLADADTAVLSSLIAA